VACAASSSFAFVASSRVTGISSWVSGFIPGFCRIARKSTSGLRGGAGVGAGGAGGGVPGINPRAAEGGAGIPHESVPGLFRVFPAFMAIYARFPAFSGGPPFVRFPVGIP
jgi:hypothetical protein